jgi:hypothetical protein
MPEWLSSQATVIDAQVPTLVIRLLLAWLCGWLIAVLARSKQPEGTRDTLTLTLVLLSILIAMATQIIGDNIARAFSLVGALSIVRFRTAVPTTREVAYVLAAVVVGMAMGAGQYWVAGIGILVVAFATQFNSSEMRNQGGAQTDTEDPAWRLTLTIGLSADQNCEAVLQRMTAGYTNLSAEVIRRGGALEMVYRVQLQPDISAVKVVAALNEIPTVESAALKQIV